MISERSRLVSYLWVSKYQELMHKSKSLQKNTYSTLDWGYLLTKDKKKNELSWSSINKWEKNKYCINIEYSWAP